MHRNGNTDRILYDAGLTKNSTIHNLDVLGLDPKVYRAVVLSHGHADHHGGLEGLYGRVRGSMPLVVHPHAWRERKIVFPTGVEIRMLHHVRKVTGVDRIHGFIGGLHLTGGLFESILPNTIQELVSLSPDLIVPGHCTGWKATHKVGHALPDAYTASNVGTTFTFHADQPTRQT